MRHLAGPTYCPVPSMPTREKRARTNERDTDADAGRVTMTVNFSGGSIGPVARAAKLRHKPPSTFVRDAAIEVANRILGLEPDDERAEDTGHTA